MKDLSLIRHPLFENLPSPREFVTSEESLRQFGELCITFSTMLEETEPFFREERFSYLAKLQNALLRINQHEKSLS